MPLSRSTAVTVGPPPVLVRRRRTLGVVAALTCLAAVAGSVQLVTGTYTPPVSALEPLGLGSWTVPGIWLTVSVALPCGIVAVLAFRRSPSTGAAAVVAGLLLTVELAVQVPFVGLDPLQAVMAVVAAVLVALGTSAHRGRSTGRATG